MCLACSDDTGGKGLGENLLDGIQLVGDMPAPMPNHVFDIFESSDPWQYQPLVPIAKVLSFFTFTWGVFCYALFLPLKNLMPFFQIITLSTFLNPNINMFQSYNLLRKQHLGKSA